VSMRIAPVSGLFASTYEGDTRECGEGGIRTHGTREGTLVFETSEQSTQPATAEQDMSTAESGLPTGLPKTTKSDAVLRHVIGAWSSLSESQRQAIVAIVEAS